MNYQLEKEASPNQMNTFLKKNCLELERWRGRQIRQGVGSEGWLQLTFVMRVVGPTYLPARKPLCDPGV